MNVSKMWRIANAAKKVGVARSTILSAIDRGQVKSVKTGCGVPLVELADVRKFAKEKRDYVRKP